MDNIVGWIGDNKEWLFSGAALTALSWMGLFFFRRLRGSSGQAIRSGDGSSNIQVGRDASIGVKYGNDAEAE